jgi:hypothetical protein
VLEALATEAYTPLRDSSGEAEYKKTLDTCVLDRRVSPDITSVSISILYDINW